MKLHLLVMLFFMKIQTVLLFANENTTAKYNSVTEKKKRFFAVLVPSVEHVHRKLQHQYIKLKKDIRSNTNRDEIAALKKKYNVKTDEELLIAIKPHPMSVTLAQAAMESAWGTSRFFREAKNIFGVHSTNKNQKRVAAGEKKYARTIWLRKFEDFEEAISQYYFMLSTRPEYKNFKRMNYENKPAVKIVEGLTLYSERGDRYVKELQSMIRYNKLTKYDTKVAKQSL